MEVYPRVCGGTSGTPQTADGRGGLSPRVRGNRLRLIITAYVKRSIPACAGEPTCGSWSARRRWVYPRVCGGTHISSSSARAIWGLSPRVRGNPRRVPAHQARLRSIPACAGEPGRPQIRSVLREVYPRVCGGTTPSSDSGDTSHGLSPRVRGNPAGPDLRSPRQRSIPACAGEPRRGVRPHDTDRVYPRVCGGTSTTNSTRSRSRGLSPRVRGNLHPAGRGDRAVRSIPACAGEPHRGQAGVEPERVYPRVCGGTQRLLAPGR